MHSSVPSVVAVYATLRWQSARFRCRPPTSSPSTLHLFWASTSPCTEPRFQEPTRSCFLLAFYTKLSQSLSPLRESGRSFSPLCTPQSERGETLRGFKDERASSARPYLLSLSFQSSGLGSGLLILWSRSLRKYSSRKIRCG